MARGRFTFPKENGAGEFLEHANMHWKRLHIFMIFV